MPTNAPIPELLERLARHALATLRIEPVTRIEPADGDSPALLVHVGREQRYLVPYRVAPPPAEGVSLLAVHRVRKEATPGWKANGKPTRGLTQVAHWGEAGPCARHSSDEPARAVVRMHTQADWQDLA